MKTPLNDRIISITDDDLSWDWDNSNPHYYTKTPKSKHGGIYVKFDPFPCYPHNKELVKETAQFVENKFPIGFDVFYFLSSFEPIGRTNGQASNNQIVYASNDNYKDAIWDGVVELYGKRIPPMPNMTRYLVSHEYGHLVDDWICHCQNKGHNSLDEEYAKMRGI